VGIDARGVVKAGSRLALIDGIRGYMLVAMFVAHVAIELNEIGRYSWLNYLRHSRYLPIGDVEFFLALSGFVAALSYQRAFAAGGIAGAARAVARRLGWLYVYQVGATVTLIMLVRGAGLTGVDLHAPDVAAPTAVLLRQALTFVVMPENLDILVLYIVILPVMPWVLAWLAKGQARRLLAVLVAAWVIAALRIDQLGQGWLIGLGLDYRPWFALAGHFSPLSYALLFYGGFALGDAWRREGPAALARVAPVRPAFVVAAAGILLGYAVLRHTLWNSVPWLGHSRDLLTVHALVTTLAIFYLGYWLLGTQHRAPAMLRLAALVRRVFNWRFFVFLGRNSLFVYAVHVVVVALAKHVAGTGGVEATRIGVLILVAAGLAMIAALTQAKRRWLPSAA